MEVHHHSHLASGETHTTDPGAGRSKKWTHYFWEFLMLFLAVFCGFLAENQREHYVEKQRAKEFAKSLIVELSADTLLLNKTITDYDSLSANIDSFLRLTESGRLEGIPGGQLYYYGDAANSAFRQAFNTATVDQLKSSGSLRYFPPALRKRIAAYDQGIQWFNLQQNNEPLLNIETKKYFDRLFDNKFIARLYSIQSQDSLKQFRQTDFALLSKDPGLVKEYANNCFGRKENWRNRIKTSLLPLKEMATGLIKALEEKY